MLEKNALNLIFKPHSFLILSNVKRCGCVNLGSIIHFRTPKAIELWPRILKLQTLTLLKQTFIHQTKHYFQPHVFFIFFWFILSNLCDDGYAKWTL
jgi:hypothetical protein